MHVYVKGVPSARCKLEISVPSSKPTSLLSTIRLDCFPRKWYNRRVVRHGLTTRGTPRRRAPSQRKHWPPFRRECSRPLRPGEKPPRWEAYLALIAEKHEIPEMRLAASVVLQALRDIASPSCTRLAADAWGWIVSQSRRDFWDFASLCDLLDLDDDLLRAAAAQWATTSPHRAKMALS